MVFVSVGKKLRTLRKSISKVFACFGGCVLEVSFRHPEEGPKSFQVCLQREALKRKILAGNLFEVRLPDSPLGVKRLCVFKRPSKGSRSGNKWSCVLEHEKTFPAQVRLVPWLERLAKRLTLG